MDDVFAAQARSDPNAVKIQGRLSFVINDGDVGPIDQRGGMNQRGGEVICAMLKHAHSIGAHRQPATGVAGAAEAIAMGCSQRVVAPVA